MTVMPRLNGGNAWVALAACTVLQFLTDGILKSFGLFYVKIIDEFGESVTFTTLITSFMHGVYCISSLPVMMFLIKTIEPRSVLMIGSTLTAIGFSLSCLAPNIYFLFFSVSLVVGMGTSCIFPPSIYVLGAYFTDRRATAIGIAISGCCLGGLLCPPLYQYLIDTYELRGALLLTGAVLFHNLPMAGLLHHSESEFNSEIQDETTCDEFDNSKDESNEKEKFGIQDHPIKINGYQIINNGLVPEVEKDEYLKHGNIFGGSHPVLNKNTEYSKQRTISAGKLSKTCSEKCLPSKLLREEKLHIHNIYKYNSESVMFALSLTDIDRYGEINDNREGVMKEKYTNISSCKLLTNLPFLSFLMANALSTIIGSTFLYFLPLHAKQNHIDDQRMVILVSLTGIMDLFGRILSGILADIPPFKPYQIIVVAQTICGVTYFCNQLLTSFPGLIVFCSLIGLFSGMYLPLRHSMMVDIAGITLYPSALAIATVSQLPVYICGPITVGLLRDSTGDFVASYHMLGSVALASAVLFLFVPIIQRLTKRRAILHEDLVE